MSASDASIEIDSGLDEPEDLRPPGWVDFGMQYSLADDLGRDPAITRAIEAIDPTFTPLLIRWVFLEPVDQQTGIRQEHVFKYHGIGRTTLTLGTRGWTVEQADDSHAIMRIPRLEVPPLYVGRIPKYLDPTVGILDDPAFLGIPELFPSPAVKFNASDLPGPFVAWDFALLHALERCYTNQHRERDLKAKHIFDPLLQRKIRGKKNAADFAGGFEDFKAYSQRTIEATGDSEFAAYLAKRANAARLARLKCLEKTLSFDVHGAT